MIEDIQLESVYYGDVRVINGDVLWAVRNAIEHKSNFYVRNENLGGDPRPGASKACRVEWRRRPGEMVLRKTADEGQDLDFGAYVSGIQYGGVWVGDAGVIDRLNGALKDRRAWARGNQLSRVFNDRRHRIPLNSDTLGGDPAYGVVKRVKIIVQDRSDLGESHYDFGEGDLFPPNEGALYPSSLAAESVMSTSSHRVYNPAWGM